MLIATQAPTLTDLVRNKPVDKCLVEQFKQQAGGVLERARDVFRKTGRTAAETDDVVRQLKDLENAVKLNVDQRSKVYQENRQAAAQRFDDLKANGLARGEVRPPYSEKLTDAPRMEIPNWKPIGPAIVHDGVRKYGAEELRSFDSADFFGIRVDPGTAAFIKDVHDLAGLFSCLGALNGPVSVTVGNFAREHEESEFHADGSVHASEHGLFQGGSSSSEGHEEGRSTYDKTSTDERILPMILDLGDRVQQASVSKGSDIKIVASRYVTEYARKGWGWFSFMKALKRGSEYQPATTLLVDRTVQVLPGDPSHLSFPSSGTSNYEYHAPYLPTPHFAY